MSILIFGGTGSIGSAIVEHLINENQPNQYLSVFSNSEHELWEAKQRFKDYITIDYILGDIRDYDAVREAVVDCTYVINCAAIKHISFADENPLEAVLTNILGLANIIKACQEEHVIKLLQISTDKAVEPVSVMGATKFIGERMCMIQNHKNIITNISCLRLGNVYGSRGSLVSIVKKAIEGDKWINLTHPDMKRYFIQLDEVVFWVMECLKIMEGGEIFIPKLQEYKIVDVIQDIVYKEGLTMEDMTIKEVGIRTREKMSEKLITDSELLIATEYDNYWVIR